MRHIALPQVAGIAIAMFVFASAAPLGAADPYAIDVVLPLTGPAAFIGKAHELSLEAAERVIDRSGGVQGRPIHFEMHDDQSSPQLAVQLMTAALAGHPAIVLDGGPAATCLATAALMKGGTVEYCLSPAIHPAPGSYVFSASSSTRDFAVSFYRYFRALGLKRIGMISSTDASGQDADNEFRSVLALPENRNSGLEIVDLEHFNPTDLNVTAALTKIKATNPQVVICYAPGTPFGTLLRGVRDTGLNVPVATGNANMSYAIMKQYADILPDQLLFPSVPAFAQLATDARTKMVYQTFFDAFKESGVKPDLLHTVAWDPAFLITDALRRFGPSMTGDQLHGFIENTRGWVGVSGTYDFRGGDQRGLGADTMVVMRWDPGKDTWVAVSALGGFVRSAAK